MNFIPFSRYSGGGVATAAAVKSKIVHTLKDIQDAKYVTVLTGITAMAAAGLIEPYREEITMATRYGDKAFAGWTIAGKCNVPDALFSIGSLKLKKVGAEDTSTVYLSDYGNNDFQAIDRKILLKTFNLDVIKLGLNLGIMHPAEILKLYLNGCFQSKVEERYADYLIGILTRYCFENGSLNQAISPAWKSSASGPSMG